MFVEREMAFQGGGDENDEMNQRQGLSFSGFLNALDGIRSQEGQILFMTTNHIEKLDPALLRPGRCDVQVKIDNASEKQIIEIFRRFFPASLTDGKDYS